MSKGLREKIIIGKILEKDYDSESLFLGNVSEQQMVDTEQKLLTGIGQNIAVVNMLDSNMAAADNIGIENIIFEYFWGFVYQGIFNNQILRKKYIDSNTEKKVAFFKSLLEKPFNSNFINENESNLFSFWPDRIKLISESDFKICLLNYQNIISTHLIKQINSLMRSRPHIVILSQKKKLKNNYTLADGEWVNIGNDFSYFDINNEISGRHEVIKKKI